MAIEGSASLGERQLEAVVSPSYLPQSLGQPFSTALDRFLAENNSDAFVEALCTPFCTGVMRCPSIPSDGLVRMTFVGYFEGLRAHCSIAWCCAQPRSLPEALGLGRADEAPDHSAISNTHKRQPRQVLDE